MYSDRIGLERLCALFGKSRQAFYDYGERQQSRGIRDTLVLGFVADIRKDLPRIGAGKLHRMLAEPFALHGIKLGRDGLYELLDRHGMLIRKRKRKARTTNSNHPYRKYPNLIRELQLSGPGQLWVSDITYLQLREGFCYLSLVTDAYSHKIVGFCLQRGLHAEGPLKALGMATAGNERHESLIHHSDRGVQYCCGEYVDALQSHRIRISMTENGDPYENQVAERVNGILKDELGLDQTFDSYEAALEAVNSAVARYNSIRPHSSVDNLTPDKAHGRRGALRKRWTNRRRKSQDKQSCAAEPVTALST
jgi:transposase InsO family protein